MVCLFKKNKIKLKFSFDTVCLCYTVMCSLIKFKLNRKRIQIYRCTLITHLNFKTNFIKRNVHQQ